MNTELSLSNPLWPVLAAIVAGVIYFVMKPKAAAQATASGTGPMASILAMASGTRLGGLASLLTLALNHKQILSVIAKLYAKAKEVLAKQAESPEPITEESLKAMIDAAIAAAKEAEAK